MSIDIDSWVQSNIAPKHNSDINFTREEYYKILTAQRKKIEEQMLMLGKYLDEIKNHDALCFEEIRVTFAPVVNAYKNLMNITKPFTYDEIEKIIAQKRCYDIDGLFTEPSEKAVLDNMEKMINMEDIVNLFRKQMHIINLYKEIEGGHYGRQKES